MGFFRRLLHESDFTLALDGAHCGHELRRVLKSDIVKALLQPLIGIGRQIVEIDADLAAREAALTERCGERIDRIVDELRVEVDIPDPAFRLRERLFDRADHQEGLALGRNDRESLPRPDRRDGENMDTGDIGEVLGAHGDDRVEAKLRNQALQALSIGFEFHGDISTSQILGA